MHCLIFLRICSCSSSDTHRYSRFVLFSISPPSNSWTFQTQKSGVQDKIPVPLHFWLFKPAVYAAFLPSECPRLYPLFRPPVSLVLSLLSSAHLAPAVRAVFHVIVRLPVFCPAVCTSLIVAVLKDLTLQLPIER